MLKLRPELQINLQILSLGSKDWPPRQLPTSDRSNAQWVVNIEYTKKALKVVECRSKSVVPPIINTLLFAQQLIQADQFQNKIEQKFKS